jgi:hypothetical protein
VRSEEFQSQLGAEIERRFEDAVIEVDGAPLEFGCEFSAYVASRIGLRTFKSGGWAFISPTKGSTRLDEAAKLPQPTLVETFIAKGFPSGELSRNATVQDDSYFLAKKESRFGRWWFSR